MQLRSATPWRSPAVSLLILVISLGSATHREALAAYEFTAVAAGDMTSSDAILWTRALDSASPANSALTAEVSTDPTFQSAKVTYSGTTDSNRDYTLKVDATGLQSGSQYYYRFVDSNGDTSQTGKFQTAPDPTASAPLHFGFSGDIDGQWRPHPISTYIPAKNLNFFVNLGDTMYETASTGSPAVTDPFTNPAQALADFHRKYLENLQPPPGGGDPGLKSFLTGQGNYTLLDNHELGNKQFQSGGAPTGTPAGAGADATNPANDVNTTGSYMNQTIPFKNLVQAFKDYQPIREQNVNAPSDPRSDGSLQQYFVHPWGKNATIFQLDDRSYRDIRLKTAGGADDTGPRADNPGRTMLGQTQLNWFETNLLKAQQQGTTWKFVLISSPIDQTGTDGGKSWAGGYRFERNQILKFIADHHIQNVVFLTTDDHQTRVSELQYQPDPSNPKTLATVPGVFQVLTGPLGAGGPDQITDHSFTNIKALADALAQQQIAKGLPPLGLDPTFLGLHNLFRQGDPTANSSPQPVDFYSPDTFNYTTFDISADGSTLTTKVWGIPSYPANKFFSAASLPPEQLILSFDLSARSAVPEPSSVVVMTIGLALVGSFAWRSRRSAGHGQGRA